MSTSITERILGNNKIYTDKYYRDIFLLTKSLTLVCFEEAKLYNEFVKEGYNFQVDNEDKSTWRYYKHLLGEQHPVDKPIQLVSIDNGEIITLTKDTIAFHRSTRDELLKFDFYYKELVDKYPDQELRIKSIINENYELEDKLPEIVREALFISGSCPYAVTS